MAHLRVVNFKQDCEADEPNVELGAAIQTLRKLFEIDLNRAKAVQLPWSGVLCWMGLIAPGVFWLNHRNRLDLALPVLGSVATIGFLVFIKWRLRRHAWFWAAILIIAALHVLLISLISWTTKWVPWVISGGIASVDFCFMLLVLSALENQLLGEMHESKKRTGQASKAIL